MRSRRTSNINIQIILAFGITVLAILSWRFAPTPGHWLGETVFRPLLVSEQTLRQHLHAAPAELSADQVTELESLRIENASLRELLNDNQEPRIAAGVIGRPTALPYDVLMIDRGAKDGVLPDAPVYTDTYTVIGFVVNTYDHSSLVALVSTPGFTSTVYIYGPNIYTTAVGIGGGVTRIHVPQGIKLSEGDPVVVPTFSSGIYGLVDVVDSVPERPEQYGYVTSHIAINSLKHVAVGTRPISIIDFETARQVVETAKRDLLMIDVPNHMLVDIETATNTATSTEESIATTTNPS